MKKPFRKQASDATELKKQASFDIQDDPFEADEARGPSPGGRHWSISGLTKKFSFKKHSLSFTVPLRDDSQVDTTRRRERSITTSTFYTTENMAVTRNVSEPADFASLQLTGKNMNELLLLLKPVS